MSRFVVANPKTCIGCKTCEIACVEAHTSENMFLGNKNIEFRPRLTVIKTAEFSAPVQCRQCENAPCANACPNGSLYERDEMIYLNQQTCIGCKMCMLACPFGAIELVPYTINGSTLLQAGLNTYVGGKPELKETLVANKCDLCVNRENGPACVEKCPTKTLRLVDNKSIAKSASNKRLKSAQKLLHMG